MSLKSPRFFVTFRIDERGRKHWYQEYKTVEVSWRHVRRERGTDICTVEIEPDQYRDTLIPHGPLYEEWVTVRDSDGNCWGQFRGYIGRDGFEDPKGTLYMDAKVEFVETMFRKDRATRTLQRFWRRNSLLKYLTLLQVRKRLDDTLSPEIADRIMFMATSHRRIAYARVRELIRKENP